MLARSLITDGIMPLKTSDTGRTALGWMEDFRVLHLPIVNDADFLGLISEFDIYNLNSLDEPLGNHQLSLSAAFVYEHQHIYEVLRLLQQYHLSLIPVIDEKDVYMGSITLQSLLEYFAHAISVNDPGAIIVLEMSLNDYSLSEIAQIVESNDAKILSLFLHLHEDSTKIDVTLKINRIEMGAVLQTFNRYNYLVKASFTEQDNVDDLRERYDALMNYLNL